MPLHRKLSLDELHSVDGLPSRSAAEILGVGKSTINNARESLRNGDFDAFAPNGTVTFDVKGSGVPQTAQEIENALAARGIDKGAYNVSYGFSAWDKGDGVGNSLRVRATPIKNQREITPLDVDPMELLKDLRSAGNETYDTRVSGESAFVFSINDTQFGKAEGGGTPATLERLEKAIQGAGHRIAELRMIGRDLGELVIIGGGDIIEGCNIFPNQAFQIDLDRRAQINTAVSSVLNVIDRLAPMFDKVTVLACRGNHGSHRQGGKPVNDHDNDDVLVFEMAKLATDRDERLSHVEYIIADDEVGVTMNVAGWILGTTHGDVLGRGNGAYAKVMAWYRGMAAGRKPMGQCDTLVTHHYHHLQSADHGAWEWHQTPALDGGSKWFEDFTGTYSEPGVLTFVMTPACRYQDEMVIR